MDNHIDLVNRGLTVKHHFGWEDYNDLGTKTTPIQLPLVNTYYEITNDGLGPNTNTTKRIYHNTAIWDTSTNSFDFSSLDIGDLVILRLTASVTTGSSNIRLSGKLSMAIGSGIDYDLPFFQGLIKQSGTHLLSQVFMLYIGNEETKNYPAKVYAAADATGVSIETEGWAIATFGRG